MTLDSLTIVNTTIKNPGSIWSGHIGVQPFIFNNDTVNTLYVGTKADVSRQDQSSCIPIPPLGGQSWPDVEIWAFAPTAVNMLIIPGATTWTPSPVQVQLALNAARLAKDSTVQNVQLNTSALGIPAFFKAGSQGVTTEIAALLATGVAGGTPGGIPLLSFKNVLASSVIAINLPANTSTGLVTAKGFNQPSYEFAFSLNSAVNPAIGYQFQLTWLDSTTNEIVATESYWVFPGSGAGINSHYVLGRGPTKADQLSISIFNPSGTTAGSLAFYVIMQNSRVYTGDLWRSISANTGPPAFNGFTVAPHFIDSGDVCGISQSVPANTTNTILLPLYTGVVDFKGFTSDGTSGNGQWRLAAPSILSAAGQDNTFLDGKSGQTGFAPSGAQSCWMPNAGMPNAQCTLRQTNNNTTTAQTMTADIIAKTLSVT